MPFFGGVGGLAVPHTRQSRRSQSRRRDNVCVLSLGTQRAREGRNPHRRVCEGGRRTDKAHPTQEATTRRGRVPPVPAPTATGTAARNRPHPCHPPSLEPPASSPPVPAATGLKLATRSSHARPSPLPLPTPKPSSLPPVITHLLSNPDFWGDYRCSPRPPPRASGFHLHCSGEPVPTESDRSLVGPVGLPAPPKAGVVLAGETGRWTGDRDPPSVCAGSFVEETESR